MKYLTLQVNENVKIDINNSLWGKETIFYNGEMVSERTSVLGSEHTFEKLEDGNPVAYKVNVGFDWMRGVVYDIFRDDQKIFTNHGNVNLSNESGLAWIFLCFAVAGFFAITLFKDDHTGSRIMQAAFMIAAFARGMQLLIVYNKRTKK